MAQVRNKVAGEHTYSSDYSEIPDGGLKSGLNVNVDRESVAEPRRGFNTYKSISASASDRGESLMEYKEELMAHFGTTVARDDADPFTALSGTFERPDHGGSYEPRIKGVEAGENFYFISKSGIKKMEAAGSTPTSSGAPRALDLNLALDAAGSGFMPDESSIAYRVVWGIRDSNDNLVLGSPSQRAVLSNTSGMTKDVVANFSIPSGITTSHFYRLYRSGTTSSTDIEPNDELQLVLEDYPTSAEISAKEISVTDQTPDSLRGETIYTAASQEGIAQSNDEPPAAKDVARFNNMLLLGNTIQKHSFNLTLLGVEGTTGLRYSNTTGDTTNGSAVVSNIPDTTGYAAGMEVSGTGIVVGTKILTVDSSTQVTLTANATATAVGVALEFYDTVVIAGTTYKAAASTDVANRKFAVVTSGTPAQDVADTAQALVKVINRYASNTGVYAHYVSNYNDLPGRIFVEARTLGASAFTVQAYGHQDAWSPRIETAQSSTAEEVKNRLHVSKVQRYEAFPRAQYFPVGAEDKEILRVIALRDVTIICKEDGFFRLTGSDPSNIVIEPIDLTVSLVAPETAAPLANQIYALTTQGFSFVNDSSVGVISRPIEDQVTPLLEFSNIDTAFAVAYETDRAYLCWVPDDESDEYPSKVHRYNVFTQKWTHWEKPARAAIVNPADNKIYYCDATTNDVFSERKNRDYTDYADEDIAVTISSVSGTTVTLTTVDGIEEGDVLTQGTEPFSEVTAVDAVLNTVTLDVARDFSAGAATVKKSYECSIEFASQFCGNPGIMKHIREVQAQFKRAEFRNCQMQFRTDLKTAISSVELSGFTSFAWGYFAWGEVPWGLYNALYKIRLWLPAEYQRCTWVDTIFYHRGAYGYFELAGMQYTYEPMSERNTD